MPQYKSIQLVISILFCLLLPSVPELAVVLLCFGGVVYFWNKNKFDRNASIPLFCFSIFQIIKTHFDLQDTGESIGEILIALLVFFGFRYCHAKIKLVSSLLLVSLLTVVVVSFYLTWNVPQEKPSDWILNGAGELASVEIFENFQRFTPINPITAYIVKSFQYQGSGKVQFSLELRASEIFEINIALLHTSLQEGRMDKRCQISHVWSKCLITATLKNRQLMSVGLGGFNTWKGGDSPIEVRNERFEVITPPQIYERLALIPRISGLTFNPNAYGALLVLVACLGVGLVQRMVWGVPLIVFSLLGIMTTGSRSALLALIVGLCSIVFITKRFSKIMSWLFVSTLLGVVTLQIFSAYGIVVQPVTIQSQPSMRAINVADQDSARGRLEIWRLATKAWLENPRTFLIGTGDLVSAMKVKFDARSSGYGLTKDSLTHAHNLWIQTAGESGLLGLLAMLWLWGWVILKAWRSRDAGALALLAAIFVINSVDYLFFYAPVHLAFWIAAAGLKQPESNPDVLEGSAIVKA